MQPLKCMALFFALVMIELNLSTPQSNNQRALWAAEKKSTPLNIYFTPGANSGGWFTVNNIDIKFDPPISPTDIQGYSLLLSQSPFYEADLVLDSSSPHWQFSAVPEGSSYLSIHVQKKNGRWIKGSTVRVKVDSLPPPAPSVIQCFDTLFEKHALAPGTQQMITDRPYFKWSQKPATDTESPVRNFRVTWQKSDGSILETSFCQSASFFPALPVSSGTYRLKVTSIDEAGWESPQPAEFEFIYSAKQ